MNSSAPRSNHDPHPVRQLAPRGQPPARLHFGSDAWLLRGSQNLSGRLVLRDGVLRYVAHGMGGLWTFQLRRLERELGLPGLTLHLGQGRPAQLFAAPVGELELVHFAWYQFGCGMHLTVRGRRLRFGFSEPTNSRGDHALLSAWEELRLARDVGARWRELLAPGRSS